MVAVGSDGVIAYSTDKRYGCAGGISGSPR
jgi:hypothetical protein